MAQPQRNKRFLFEHLFQTVSMENLIRRRGIKKSIVILIRGLYEVYFSENVMILNCTVIIKPKNVP